MSGRTCWICKMRREASERRPEHLALEEVLAWAQSFEKLMATKLITATCRAPWTHQVDECQIALLLKAVHAEEPPPESPDGPVVYAAYLKREHSDENIKFWMACETYKKIASRWSRISQAKKLYKIYIQPQSPREINIDSSTRETILRNIQEPTEACFEEAQRTVYMHMERDSYPRFLKSEMYQKLVKAVQSDNNS